MEPAQLKIADPSELAQYAHPHVIASQISSNQLHGLVVMIFIVTAIGAAATFKLLGKDRVSLSAISHATFNYGLASSLALFLTAAITNVIKCFVGRMRPDFLNRCFPSMYRPNVIPHFEYNLLDTPILKCEPASPFDVLDGRRSFPSGHSSYAAAVCLVAAVYFYRLFESLKHVSVAANCKALSATAVSFTAAIIPAYVASTRVVDRRHHPTDVLGGLLLGALLALFSSWVYFKDLRVQTSAKGSPVPHSSDLANYLHELSPLNKGTLESHHI